MSTVTTISHLAAEAVHVTNQSMTSASEKVISKKAKDIASIVDQEADIVDMHLGRDDPQTIAQGIATSTKIAADSIHLANTQIQNSSAVSDNAKLAAAITDLAAPLVEAAIVTTANLADRGKCSCTCQLV